jgi:phage shock protein A
MSDPRRQHTDDPRPQHGEGRQAQQTVLYSVPADAFAQFLVQRRRNCYQEAAEIEKLLQMDSTEAKLRKEVELLKQKLRELTR